MMLNLGDLQCFVQERNFIFPSQLIFIHIGVYTKKSKLTFQVLSVFQNCHKKRTTKGGTSTPVCSQCVLPKVEDVQVYITCL